MALKRALPPTHPGEILREDVLPALGLSIIDAAEKLGVTRPRLGLNLQSAYDLWHAERRIDTRRIPTLHAAE